MGSTIGVNDGFSGIDGKIQSSTQVDGEIHLSLTFVSGTSCSIDSSADRGASDC